MLKSKRITIGQNLNLAVYIH